MIWTTGDVLDEGRRVAVGSIDVALVEECKLRLGFWRATLRLRLTPTSAGPPVSGCRITVL